MVVSYCIKFRGCIMQSFDKKSDSKYDIGLNEDEEYSQYLNTITKQLPKMLLKYYNESYSEYKHNRFHDCVIKELCFFGKSQFYKNTNDEIKLVLMLGNKIEYTLYFSKIVSINISLKNQDYFIDNFGFLGEILDCRLGVSNMNYTIEFCTSTSIELFLEFKKVRCSKKIMK